MILIGRDCLSAAMAQAHTESYHNVWVWNWAQHFSFISLFNARVFKAFAMLPRTCDQWIGGTRAISTCIVQYNFYEGKFVATPMQIRNCSISFPFISISILWMQSNKRNEHLQDNKTPKQWILCTYAQLKHINFTWMQCNSIRVYYALYFIPLSSFCVNFFSVWLCNVIIFIQWNAE